MDQDAHQEPPSPVGELASKLSALHPGPGMKKTGSDNSLKKVSSETFLAGYMVVEDAKEVKRRISQSSSIADTAMTHSRRTSEYNADGGDAAAACKANGAAAPDDSKRAKRTVFHATYRVTTDDEDATTDSCSGAGSDSEGATAQQDEDSLEHFKVGFARFREELIETNKEFFSQLAGEQHPKTMVIACCDSRVDPAVLMGAGPGDLFVFRNIANMVPAYERNGNFHGTSAALEYAVVHLKVRHIVVLGHKNCGGIKALMTRVREPRNSFIDSWVEIGAPAAERTKLKVGHLPFAQQCATCEREAINVSLANLLTFPWIKEAVGRRELKVHGWYYDLESAAMETWELQYHVNNYEVI